MNRESQKPLDHKSIIALQNKTRAKLQVKNNMIITFGPQKGQWVTHKEYHLAPGECVTTDFLQGETHQIMVYEASHASDVFFYMIRDTDIDNGQSAELYDDHYKIINGLLCIQKQQAE